MTTVESSGARTARLGRLPRRLLVANRGEIARRIERTARRLAIMTVVGHSRADAGLPFVREADHAVEIGVASAADTYLNLDRLMAVARDTGCEAVHPGYGFLSENPAFATAVLEAGLTWVGPDPAVMEAMGDKIRARRVMASAGVPVGSGEGTSLLGVEDARRQAAAIGYPVMLKASAGGGGIGMAVVHDADQLAARFEETRARSERAFGSSEVFVERYLNPARHIEVQVLGLADGTIVVLGDRDCSVQRRNQKVVEEAPAAALGEATRARLHAAARSAAGAVRYENAGTVEFLVDPRSEEIVFLEMNTRLQVEHTVTESVYGIGMVEEQLRIAAGLEPAFGTSVPTPVGAAVEFRVYAEDPVRFLPRPGRIESWVEPAGDGIRVDSGYAAGDVVAPYYDPLLAKVIAHGRDREEALARSRRAVEEFGVSGIQTNLDFIRRVLSAPEYVSGVHDTGLVARLTEIQGRREVDANA